MTMEDTIVSAGAKGVAGYPLDPLSGAEIEAAAAIITGSEYATPALKFVMIQLAEPAKTAALTCEGALDVPGCAFGTVYDAGAKLVSGAGVDLGARMIVSRKS